MRIIKRDIRMAGFEYRDNNAIITYGSISSPLTIKDSGNKCCDEVTVIYDYFDEASKKAERIRIRYWAGLHTSNKGSRHRLYKQKDILGQNKKILATPILGTKDVMADYIEDLQIGDANASISQSNQTIQSSGYIKIDKDGGELSDSANKWSCVKDKKTELIWEVKTDDGGIHDKDNRYRWGGVGAPRDGTRYGYYDDWNPLVNGSNDETLCGQSGWRVPAIDELSALVVTGKGHPTINTNYFPNAPAAVLWSSSSFEKLRATRLNFYNGAVMRSSLRNSSDHVRLVSTHSSSSILKLININLTLRTKNQTNRDRRYQKKDYHGGNFKIDKTDKYKRDTFSSTVLVRNLAL
jgi:hypothetical protein